MRLAEAVNVEISGEHVLDAPPKWRVQIGSLEASRYGRKEAASTFSSLTDASKCLPRQLTPSPLGIALLTKRTPSTQGGLKLEVPINAHRVAVIRPP